MSLHRDLISDLLLKARMLGGNTREISILALKCEAGHTITHFNQVIPLTYMI